jgi:hypothetical protein
VNNEQNIEVIEDEMVEDSVEAYYAAQRDANIQRMNFLGKMTGWRENISDNSRRSQILAGQQKIQSLLSRFVA